MLESHKKGDEIGCDRGGLDDGAVVGDTLRNAWKVSESSGRHWTDNPARHKTMLLPSSLLSALFVLSLFLSYFF